jgi:hypothetical protein
MMIVSPKDGMQVIAIQKINSSAATTQQTDKQ